MNTKQLRQKILDLAIRGKLVPQDPNDEPASVLLERIKAEKEQLIKEGKIKRPKKSATTSDKPHYADWELPNGWVWIKLEDIAIDMADGPFGSNLKSTHYTTDREVRIIQLSNIGEYGWRDDNVRYTTFEHAKDIQRSVVDSGDIVIAKMMPAGRAIICPNKEKAYVLSSDAVKLKPSSLLNINYLLYAINSPLFQNQVNENVQGVTRLRTSIAKLKSYVFPLPPLNEQTKIVNSLIHYLSIIDNIQVSIENIIGGVIKIKYKILELAICGKLVPQDPADEPAEELLRSINPAAVPADKSHYQHLPKGWCESTLGKIGKWQSGGTPSKYNKDYYNGNIPWLLTGDLNDGIITDIPNTISELGIQNSSAKLNPTGSILIAMYGATIGKLGILNKPAATNQACCACIEHKGITPKYLFYFLLSKREYFKRIGGGGAQPNISKDKITKTPIPIPPYNEQCRIVEAIENINRRIDDIAGAL